MNERSQKALKRLLDGNERFSNGLRSVEAMASIFNKSSLAKEGQKPFAMILACSDSRTPVEILFDQGIGDLFVMRVAGNIAAPSLVASMEFAFTNLNVPLCLVMGHTKCGAVLATIERSLGKFDGENGESKLSPHLQLLTDEIYPNLKNIHRSLSHTEAISCVDDVALSNVHHTIEKIKELSLITRNLLSNGQIAIQGAMYDMESGKVKII